MVGGQADATIAYAEADPLALTPGQQRQTPVACGYGFHCIHRIEDQVADHLLHLYAIGLHRRQVGVQQQGHGHAMLVQFAARQRQHFLHRLVQVEGAPFRCRALGQAADAGDHVTGAVRVCQDAGYGLPGLVHVRRVLRQPALAGFGAAGDGR